MIAESPSVGLPCVALIPAYNPDRRLLQVVVALADSQEFEQIVVVNDGSHSDCVAIFEEVRAVESVTVLEHAVNLGKGAALKTGLNHVCCRYDDAAGIVTADADGQHLSADILEVAAQLRAYPHSLTIGTRSFQGDVPLRSRFGNVLTKAIFRMLVGCNLLDTQSGLRGVPLTFARQLLRLNSSGYDFELDMLIQARTHSVPLRQLPIATVYEEGNTSSHFNPLRDSLMIYLVFLRFMFASVVTAVVGLTAYHIVYQLTANLLAGEAALCVTGVMVNFILCRKVVFRSRRSVLPTLAKFLGLVCVVGVVSYFMTWGLTELLPIGVITARIVAALILYLANFTVQRDFVFQMRDASQAALGTDTAYRAEEAAPVVLAFRAATEDTWEDSGRKAA
jgi:glycosyltransferase involved in cell wall biosynthesis